MGWASETNILSDTSVDSVEQLTSEVALNPGEIAHVQVRVKNKTSSSFTNDCVVSAYSTTDTIYDNIALTSQTLTASSNYIKASFIMSGMYKFKFGLKSAGATDNYTASVDCRKDGVNL